MNRTASLLVVALFASSSVLAQKAGAPSDADVLKMKEKLALATRMMTHEGLIASSGHLSMRIPGTNRVLVGPAEVSRGIVSTDDIVTVDLNSNQIDGRRKKPGETE